MRRPQKIVKYFFVEEEQHGIFVDYNGKPKCQYLIRLPYWLCRAYRPQHVKIEVREKVPSFRDRREEENAEEFQQYFKENWLKKMTKMRKLNHNYLLVSLQGKGKSWFESIEDYNDYHKELKALNEKYLKKKRGV